MSLFHGLSMGFMSVTRAQISSSSSEIDRPRAFSLFSLSITFGSAGGPLIASIFTLLPYPGIEYIPGLHLNLYTAPIFLMIICSIIALCCLISPKFHGRLTEAPIEFTGKT